MALDEVTRRLRRDCPWDREQDERSIVPHTVEESYELAEAAHAGDDSKMLDELGDVLFQVYFLSLLLEERRKGDLGQVARGVTKKLVRRHPHVFGEEGSDALAGLPTEARTPAQVRENWDAIKRAENDSGFSSAGKTGSIEGSGSPAGIGEGLPALIYARKLQRRAEGGSDRGAPSRALDDLRRAIESAAVAVSHAGDTAEAQEQTRHGSDLLYERIGELLFTAVELARSLQVDPEVALRRFSTEKFRG